jgi:GNAT superfamily N-acetyltransferase
VVRHRDDDGRLTDVLGRLESYDGTGLRVRSADGSISRIPHASVVAGRVVPALRVTTREIRALESAAALAWPGLEQHRVGGWLLRAGRGFTGRANSVLPLGDPGEPLAAAVEAMQQWYEERGLPPRAQLPDRVGDALDAALRARGWPAYNPTVVLVAPTSAPEAGDSSSGLPPVRVGPEPDDDWLAAYHYRGGELPEGAADVLRAGSGLGFAKVVDGGAVLAVARAAVTAAPDGTTWLGLTAVEVVPQTRRQGLGRHLATQLLAWGASAGATRCYVQMAADNAPARRLYDRLGFSEHHRYVYRRSAQPGAARQ